MNSTESMKAWMLEMQEESRSGDLAASISNIFGSSSQQWALDAFINALANGDFSVLPIIQTLDSETLANHLGAYGSLTKTIYLNEDLVDQPTLVIEVLTHELAHYMADQFFNGQETVTNAYDFTAALLGKDHALLLSNQNPQAENQVGQIVLPEGSASVDVAWFDTTLHIDWVKSTLTMFNATALNLITRAENDSDAFAIANNYGLQTNSSTHFDNNNVRGGIEFMRKRWADGLEDFNKTEVADEPQPHDPWTNLPNGNYDSQALIGPRFSGDNAGVENMIYRFGQVSHAFQDFYSHSNWVELGKNGQWLTTSTLLDSGLALPVQLNPGDFVPTASKVMVAMSGINYGAIMNTVGNGTYGFSSSDVYWWVGLDKSNWGNVFGSQSGGSSVGGLMTGAVNGAVYHDTDYSVYLRGVDRGGWTQQEYFRGFSHGGLAGTISGQWVSPLSKDKENNGRFFLEQSWYETGPALPDLAENKLYYDAARSYANLQIQNDFDRMGNLIYAQYGVDGLRKFADFALVADMRDLYVSTYSTPNARWDWSQPSASVQAARSAVFQIVESDTNNPVNDSSSLRTVEVFHQDADANLVTASNRSYITQVNKDGRWLDSAAGVVGIHYDEDTPGLYSVANKQHAETGGRMLTLESVTENGHYLSTIYTVENINNQARVFINNFDVGIDQIRIVDASGALINTIDVDPGDYDQVHQMLLDKRNILINARPEVRTLTHEKILFSDQTQGQVLLDAVDFFGDEDLVRGAQVYGAVHSTLKFVNQDETLPWLKLREDGKLEISDLSQVNAGTYQIYVSVSDGAGVLDGVPIVISVDPKVLVGDQAYDASSKVSINFRLAEGGAISIFGQVVDGNGVAASHLQHLAMRVGDNAGTPIGIDTNNITSELSDKTNHGTMKFYAYFHDSNEMVGLDVENLNLDQFILKIRDQTLADITIGNSDDIETHLEEIYIPGINDLLLGVRLNHLIPRAERDVHQYQISLHTTVSRESAMDGEFGLFLADLETGSVVDPTTGIQLEHVILSTDNIEDFSVYSVAARNGVTVEDSASFLIDPHLSLHNIGLLPYYKVANGQFYLGTQGQTPDGVSHIQRIGQNAFGVEDLVGGDYDYDDIIVGVNNLVITDLLTG